MEGPDLSDLKRHAMAPHLPNKQRGLPLVRDRQVAGRSSHLGSPGGREDNSSRWRRPDDRRFGRACPSTACNRKRGGRDHCLGRFRCGFTTEIHARVDAHGRPIRPKLTAGLASATELIGHLAPGAMLMAGDGNDAYALCALVGECGA